MRACAQALDWNEDSPFGGDVRTVVNLFLDHRCFSPNSEVLESALESARRYLCHFMFFASLLWAALNCSKTETHKPPLMPLDFCVSPSPGYNAFHPPNESDEINVLYYPHSQQRVSHIVYGTESPRKKSHVSWQLGRKTKGHRSNKRSSTLRRCNKRRALNRKMGKCRAWGLHMLMSLNLRKFGRH